jgi:hypothetical protein
MSGKPGVYREWAEVDRSTYMNGREEECLHSVAMMIYHRWPLACLDQRQVCSLSTFRDFPICRNNPKALRIPLGLYYGTEE